MNSTARIVVYYCLTGLAGWIGIRILVWIGFFDILPIFGPLGVPLGPFLFAVYGWEGVPFMIIGLLAVGLILLSGFEMKKIGRKRAVGWSIASWIIIGILATLPAWAT